MGEERLRGPVLSVILLLRDHSEQRGVCGERDVGTETERWEWVRVGRECHSYAPTALLGRCPGIAVVRTTFLKWVLMFFTAGKYAIMGIFPSRFLGRRAPSPSSCPHCSLYFPSDRGPSVSIPTRRRCPLLPHRGAGSGLVAVRVCVPGTCDRGDVTRFTAGQQGPAQEARLADGGRAQERGVGGFRGWHRCAPGHRRGWVVLSLWRRW